MEHKQEWSYRQIEEEGRTYFEVYPTSYMSNMETALCETEELAKQMVIDKLYDR